MLIKLQWKKINNLITVLLDANAYLKEMEQKLN